MSEIIELLKTRKLKATPQRLAILEFLNGKTHPTIEEIYEAIKKGFPSISLATIYKNINTLKEMGVVTELNPGGKAKYDINITPHFHGVCQNCGKIVDYFDSAAMEKCKDTLSEAVGEDIKGLNITIDIVCSDCSK